MPSSPPRRRPWSGRESPQTSPSSCPGTCLWRIWICAPCWATLWTTPSRAAGAPGNGESPSAARRTRDSSCCGWRTPWAARCSRILQLPRRTSPPTASAIPGMREIAERYGRHPGRRGPGQRVRAGGVPAPGRAGPKHCKSPCADGRRRHRRELDFPYLRVFAQKNREAVQWTVSLLRSQSGLKASSKVRSVPRRGQ